MTKTIDASDMEDTVAIISVSNKTFRLNLDDRHEKMYFDSLSGKDKIIDEYIAEKFIRSGDIVIDIGANIGFCSLIYLHNGASKVYAFEPHPIIFNRLKELSGDDLVTYDIAISNFEGEHKLLLSYAHNQGHTLNKAWADYLPNVFDKEPPAHTVKVSTLDKMLPDVKADFIKVDIEGVEIEFLEGANNTLTNSKPRALQIEIYPPIFDDTYSLLKKHFHHVKRAVVNAKTHELELLDVNDVRISSKDMTPSPPTFVCFDSITSV